MTIIISFLLSGPETEKAGGFPPALHLFQHDPETKKAGGDVLSALGFRLFSELQLFLNQTSTPGRRPKIKAAPKGKDRKSEKAVSNHGVYSCRF
jgi:hypothetical protein